MPRAKRSLDGPSATPSSTTSASTTTTTTTASSSPPAKSNSTSPIYSPPACPFPWCSPAPRLLRLLLAHSGMFPLSFLSLISLISLSLSLYSRDLLRHCYSRTSFLQHGQLIFYFYNRTPQLIVTFEQLRTIFFEALSEHKIFHIGNVKDRVASDNIRFRS